MAKVFIEETTLTAIGDAIRGKEGTTELVPVNDMADRISGLETGSDPVIEALEITSNGTYTATDCDGYSPITVNVPQDGAPPESAFSLTGDCSYMFAYGKWDWFIEQHKDKMSTKNISSLAHTFDSSNLEAIPMVLNITGCYDFNGTFMNADITECPKIRGTFNIVSSFSFYNLLYGCKYLRDVEDLFDPSMLDSFSAYKPTSTSNNTRVYNFLTSCYSLRRVPSWLYKLKLNPEAGAISTSYNLYNGLCQTCYALDEALNMPVWTCNGGTTSNLFSSNYLSNCNRLKGFTFETVNGQPVVAKWKSQTISLTAQVGYVSGSASYILGYNSGITKDKEVKDDATYQALKNDPDWFTCNVAYSRYNHDSAVETINSLPDTSAYLASVGGTNTIKFTGASGSKTDGGAINTLTAEEIAVAAAKGWTVTLS